MTTNDTKKLLVTLQILWPEVTIDDPLIALYHRMLADLPWLAVNGAAEWHMAEEKWFPKPGELRDKAITLLDGIVRFDSYPGLGQTGLQRKVRLALDNFGHAQLEA